jgi:hypothetical protein
MYRWIPGYPADRIAYILEDAAPVLLVTDKLEVVSILPESRETSCHVDDAGRDLDGRPGHDLAVRCAGLFGGVRHLHLGFDRPSQGRRGRRTGASPSIVAATRPSTSSAPSPDSPVPAASTSLELRRLGVRDRFDAAARRAAASRSYVTSWLCSSGWPRVRSGWSALECPGSSLSRAAAGRARAMVDATAAPGWHWSPRARPARRTSWRSSAAAVPGRRVNIYGPTESTGLRHDERPLAAARAPAPNIGKPLHNTERRTCSTPALRPVRGRGSRRAVHRVSRTGPRLSGPAGPVRGTVRGERLRRAGQRGCTAPVTSCAGPATG